MSLHKPQQELSKGSVIMVLLNIIILIYLLIYFATAIRDQNMVQFSTIWECRLLHYSFLVRVRARETQTDSSSTFFLPTTLSAFHWDGPHITWTDRKNAEEIPIQLQIWMGFRACQEQVKQQNILKFTYQILWNSFQANLCSFLG